MIFVDRVWKLKRLCETELNLHIPLNMILNDDEYRVELLEKALTVENHELTDLVWEIRKLEDQLVAEAVPEKGLQLKKKSRNRIRLHYLSAVPIALFIFLMGYLFRSFLPLATGDVFLWEAVANSAIKPAIVETKPQVYSSTGLQHATQPLFRLHGSNTLGEKLTPKLVEAYLMSQGASQIVTVDGENLGEKMVKGTIGNTVEYVEVHAHGSGTAFTDLLGGATDIGMSSRRIKDQEHQSLLSRYGDLKLPENEMVIGLDGLAIIVHSSNPVRYLTVTQVSKIFSGEITNWSQVGGKDLPIGLYARDEKSGTWDSFKSMVLDPNQVTLDKNAKRYESSTSLSDEVAKNVDAIGFIGLPYVRRAKLLAIAATKDALAILPNHFTVSTEDYVLSRRLYFYSPPESENYHIETFLKFVAGERAQSLVDDVGFVSRNIKMGDSVVLSAYPPEMRKLVSDSNRLSLNFRFEGNSDQLDNKALQDLDRLVRFVEKNAPMRVQLFGFSDEVETEEGTVLSQRRAQVVEEHLISRGVFPLFAKGMGAVAPLASSKTEEGRRVNRRVEIWLL